jgi:outer membrane lipoprotein-sorting protein
MRIPSLFFATLLLPMFAGGAETSLNLAPIKQWIERQNDFRSVSADFVQTRSLRTLKSPLESPGHLWFVAPNTFRWELGKPAKTIVVRKGDSMLIVTPAKRRAERQSANAAGGKGGMQSLAMLSFPLAESFADFQRKFEVLSVEVEGNRCRCEILPRDAGSRRMMRAMTLEFDTRTAHVVSLGFVARDGSSLENRFSNIRVNPPIDRDIFDVDLEGYEVVNAR